MKMSEYCAKLDAALASRPVGAPRYELITQALCQAFRLQADEVAILLADREHDVLRFEWPAKLKNSGTIPLSARDSLASRTLRENRSQINNRFAATYHAAIFEHIKIDPSAPERPQAIQKILSVPLPGAEAARGVVQVSRKGVDANQTGPDFTPADAANLETIAAIVTKHI